MTRTQMVTELAAAQTLEQLDRLTVQWIGYSYCEEDPGEWTADTLREFLAGYITEGVEMGQVSDNEREYQIIAIDPRTKAEETRTITASSIGEALTIAERQDAARATRNYGITSADFDAARDEGIEFNETDGRLV